MKPNLGTTVYTIYETSIEKNNVGFLGKESFIIEDRDCKIEEALEFMYDDFETTWFKSFTKAKKHLLNMYKGSKLVKNSDTYWEIG